MEFTVIFLCKHVVKKLAYKLHIFLLTKEFGMQHIVTQISKQTNKTLQYNFKLSDFIVRHFSDLKSPTQAQKSIITFSHFRRGFGVLWDGFQGENQVQTIIIIYSSEAL